MTDTALPVALDLADPDLAAEVASHVESHLGWQVIQPGPHLPARLLLADRVSPDLPTVVVAWSADGEQIRSALRAGALDVLVWPGDASRLGGLAPAVVPQRPADHLLVVAGAAPGVGATTVALALGALAAWQVGPTVVVTDAAGRRLAGVAPTGTQRVAGVAGLQVGDRIEPPQDARRPAVMVADMGPAQRASVLVAHPDATLVEGLVATPDTATVVTVGEGALRAAELRRLLDGRRHVALDRSFRVARAGLRGRVPVGLPGRYLQALRPLLPAAATGVAA